MDEKEKYKEFVLMFFEKLGCDINELSNIYEIKNIPKSFSDLANIEASCKICFDKKREGVHFVFPSSLIGRAISKFLDDSGKTTLLSIEFDVNPNEVISKNLLLKNCEVESVTKKYRDNFFSRFSFLTTFRYFNEKKQVLNEVYVHNGKVVEGNLLGYEVVEGKKKLANFDFLKNDLNVAKNYLKKLLEGETSELSKVVGKWLDKEIERVKDYYRKQLDEYSLELQERIKKINDTELELRLSEDKDEKELLRKRLNKMKSSLVKFADDEAKERVLREQEFTIRDVKEKYSLNIQNRILNTTVIYYPVFSFNLFFKNEKTKRIFELIYDPLVESFENLKCEVCGANLLEVILDDNGHIVCNNCLTCCDECGGSYCLDCVKRTCSVCSKHVCSDCFVICRGCSKGVCKTHIRIDSVSGEERCINCLRACSRCHNLSSEKYFGISSDGSKVCFKCLGVERQEKALRSVFD